MYIEESLVHGVKVHSLYIRKISYRLGAIGASLGVDIGKSKKYETSYRINLKENEIKTIIFRPKIDVYKVVQTKYKINMLSGKMTPIREEVAYVDVFNNWDYSWRNGY